MPSLPDDAAAEQFIETADLSAFDLSGFKPAHFEFEAKSAAKGMPYTRYVRLLIENDLSR